MTRLFQDSFDHYTTAAQAALKWGSGSTVSGCSTAYGRNGTQGLRIAGAWVRRALTNEATLISGFAFSYDRNIAGDGVIASYDDAGTRQVDVRLQSGTAKLIVTRNGTQLGIGATVLTVGTKYYIEFKATIHPTAGVAVVRINNVVEINLASQNTRATANSFATTASIENSNGNLFFDFDDYYLNNAAGAQNNDFDGDQRIQCLFPSADGATSAWTPNSGTVHNDRVKEATPDDDTTYLSSATVGQRDTWAYGDLVAATGSIKAIQFVPYVRKDDAGVRTVAPVVRIGGVDYDQASLPNLGTTYQFLPLVQELSPATGIAFTIAEVNAMEGGIKMVA